MKVLLVSTPFEQTLLFPQFTDDSGNYPLGLAYLHSYLELKGHSVETLWLNNYPTSGPSILLCSIRNRVPDVIGFNMLTINRESTYAAIEIIHSTYPEIQIVLGGIHATIMYRQLLEKYPYVIVIRGEGEITFADLLDNLESPCKVFGVVYSDNGIVCETASRPLIENLDTLPFPKHELFFKGSRVSANILTSRGCGSGCSFCCLNPISKRTVRFRSVKNVIEEIEYLVKTFPNLKTIWIQDDSFFLNNGRVIQICDEIISKDFPVEFRCAGRVKPLSKELVLKLEQAGFVEVQLGLESGDADVLAGCHKGITLQDVSRAVTLFAETNINLTLYVIVGLPGETRTTILNSAKFIQGLQRIKYIHFFDIPVLSVYPGTEVYELAKSRGLINDTFWIDSSGSFLYPVSSTYKELLLDYIGMDRIVTLRGFVYQWYMLPWIVWYNLKYDRKTKRLQT